MPETTGDRPKRSSSRAPAHLQNRGAASRKLPGNHSRELKDALGGWLNAFTWTHWGTFTFGKAWGADGPSAPRAFHYLGQFLHSERGAPGYFCCIEKGSFGRVHGHALLRFDQFGIRGIGQDAGSHTFNAWRKRFGRCQVRTYDPELGAAYYCSKYILKAPLHWDVGRLTLEA